MFRIRGLKKRWLFTTVGVVLALGMVCVMAVTAVFAGQCYTALETDLYRQVKAADTVLEKQAKLDYDGFSEFCVEYVMEFDGADTVQLQFVGMHGKILASSSGQWVGKSCETNDITAAANTRSAATYLGRDPQTEERIMAVSSPVIYSNGKIVGVLRYVAPTAGADRQILLTFLISFVVLALCVAVVFLCSNYCVQSVLEPIKVITETAKRITNGSYGAKIPARYEDEMGALADAINEMSMKISQNEKMQTEFISSLSHELRTPLTAITGWSETLLDSDELDHEASRGVKIISGEAKRLTEMVKELLDLTRIQEGQMTLNIEKTDIRAEFEDTVFMYGSRLAQDGITLDYLDNDDEIPEVSCDPMRLRQVFLNILDNAAKHGGDGKRVEVSLVCQDGFIVIRIRDFGPGIPEDELPLVKCKFYKGSSKARGTGIGLAVCEEIIQLHSGELILENAEGGGTLVTVRLPVNG